MWMLLSSGYIQLKICKAFCQTPRNDFDFEDEILFENRSLHALGMNILAKKMKEIFKATSLSQLYKSWSSKPSYNAHICSFQWAQSCPMQKKTVRGSAQWWNAQTLSLEALIHTSRTLKVILTVQNFPINQRKTDACFQLQGMFSSCNIGSVNVVLKENWE